MNDVTEHPDYIDPNGDEEKSYMDGLFILVYVLYPSIRQYFKTNFELLI